MAGSHRTDYGYGWDEMRHATTPVLRGKKDNKV